MAAVSLYIYRVSRDSRLIPTRVATADGDVAELTIGTRPRCPKAEDLVRRPRFEPEFPHVE